MLKYGMYSGVMVEYFTHIVDDRRMGRGFGRGLEIYVETTTL